MYSTDKTKNNINGMGMGIERNTEKTKYNWQFKGLVITCRVLFVSAFPHFPQNDDTALL